MSDRVPTHPKTFVLAATALALVLSGCSGRDTDNAEKVARAEAAADRAEEAAKRAEAAAKRLPPPPVDAAPAEEEEQPDQQAEEPAPEPEPA